MAPADDELQRTVGSTRNVVGRMTVDGDGKVQIGNSYSTFHNYSEPTRNRCLDLGGKTDMTDTSLSCCL